MSSADELQAANDVLAQRYMRVALQRDAAVARAEKAEAAMTALYEEVARLRAALVKAEDLAAEGVGYTEAYFVKKWRMAERLEEVRAALRPTSVTSVDKSTDPT